MSVFVHIYIFFQHAANVMKQFRNFDDSDDVRGIGKLKRDRSVRSKGNVKITIDPSQCLSDVSTYTVVRSMSQVNRGRPFSAPFL